MNTLKDNSAENGLRLLNQQIIDRAQKSQRRSFIFTLISLVTAIGGGVLILALSLYSSKISSENQSLEQERSILVRRLDNLKGSIQESLNTLSQIQDKIEQGEAEAARLQAEALSVNLEGTSLIGVAIVFDPPSNVRATPGGDIICSVREKITINIYGTEGSWYQTDACDKMGFIHKSQIRF